MLFFKRNWSPLFFISVSGSFSVVHANVDIKLSQMKDSASLLFFSISKSPAGFTIYCRNTRVLEMQNFTPAYMNGLDARTDVLRTDDFYSEPKFLGQFSYWWCSAERESSAKTCWMIVRWVLLWSIRRGRKNYQTHFVLLVSSLFSVSYILRSYWMYQQERWRVEKKKLLDIRLVLSRI